MRTSSIFQYGMPEGGQAGLSEDELRNRQLIKNASAVSLSLTLVFMIFYLFRGWWGPFIFDVPLWCGMAAAHMISSGKSVKVSAFLLFVSLTTMLYFVPNLFLGKESGVHFFLLSIIPFVVIVFPDRRDLWFVVFIGATDLLAFAVTEYVPFSPPFKVNTVPLDLKLLHIASTAGMILAVSSVLLMLYNEMVKAKKSLDREHRRSESLLLNILPASIAERLKSSPDSIAHTFPEATVLFADIAGFTEFAATLSPDRIVEILNIYFSAYDELAEKHTVEKIKTIGDAYMVAAGIPEPRSDHAEVLVLMATDMLEVTEKISRELGIDLRIRIGINSGRVTAGVIGKKKFIYDLWGDAVNTASRMESHGIAGRVQVGPLTYRLLKDMYHFEERGEIDIKGKGKMDVYLLKALTSKKIDAVRKGPLGELLRTMK